MTEEKIRLQGTKRELMQIIPQISAMYQLIEEKDIGTIYGEPSSEFQVRRKFKPQIELFFKEDEADVQLGYSPVSGRISFRIADEEYNTITNTKATTIARKIKETFGSNDGYIWRKGKELYSYSDWNKGYQLQLLCRNETNARNLVTLILAIQGHTLINKNFQLCKNQDELAKYPYEPPKELIMGELVRMPRYRPNVEVRFQYAALHIHGLPRPKLLYSRTRTRRNMLIS